MKKLNVNLWLSNENKSITVYDNNIAVATSIDEAVFVRRILYLWQKFNKQPMFIVPERFCHPVGMSVYSFRKIVRQWEKDKLITTECHGLPLKKYYAINEENLSSYLNKIKYTIYEQSILNAELSVERNNPLVRLWRMKVFKRDSYTCQECGAKDSTIQAHHIKPWKDNPDVRLDLNNGITLCLKCHKQIHPWM
jgi:hypothetical protein